MQPDGAPAPWGGRRRCSLLSIETHAAAPSGVQERGRLTTVSTHVQKIMVLELTKYLSTMTTSLTHSCTMCVHESTAVLFIEVIRRAFPECKILLPRVRLLLSASGTYTTVQPDFRVKQAVKLRGRAKIKSVVLSGSINRQGYQVKNLFRDGTPPIVLIVPYSGTEFSARVRKHLQQYRKSTTLFLGHFER